jgi:hypothetical protein
VRVPSTSSDGERVAAGEGVGVGVGVVGDDVEVGATVGVPGAAVGEPGVVVSCTTVFGKGPPPGPAGVIGPVTVPSPGGVGSAPPTTAVEVATIAIVGGIGGVEVGATVAVEVGIAVGVSVAVGASGSASGGGVEVAAGGCVGVGGVGVGVEGSGVGVGPSTTLKTFGSPLIHSPKLLSAGPTLKIPPLNGT